MRASYPRLVVALLALMAAGLSAADAATLGVAGVSIEPTRGTVPSPWLVYELNPGQTVHDSATVRNDSSVTRVIDVYPADAQEHPGGAFTANPRSATPSDAGAWISLSLSQVTLKPHTSKTVAVTISVPQDVEPGEHLASIIAEFEGGGSGTGGPVQVVQRVGLRVYITISGNVSLKATITQFSASQWWQRGLPGAAVPFTLRLRNDGNVHLRVAGTARVGSDTISLVPDQTYDVVAPGQTLILDFTWHDAPFCCREDARASIDYANLSSRHDTVTAGATVWLIPWQAILAALALLFLVTAGALAGWRRIAARGPSVAGYQGIRLVLTSVQEHELPRLLPPPAGGGQRLVLRLEAHNVSRQLLRIRPDRLSLRDQHGNEYAPDQRTTTALDAATEMVIPAGGSASRLVGFSLPLGARPRFGTYATQAGKITADIANG